MSGLGFEGLRNYYISIRVAGALGIAALGVGGFAIGKSIVDKQRIMNQMEWLADHNTWYGNHNGRFDLVEEFGILQDLKAGYSPNKNININDAKRYIELYKNSTISPRK